MLSAPFLITAWETMTNVLVGTFHAYKNNHGPFTISHIGLAVSIFEVPARLFATGWFSLNGGPAV